VKTEAKAEISRDVYQQVKKASTNRQTATKHHG